MHLRVFIQSCDGVFDEEISTSRPLFEYNISILVVWVNHLINLKTQFIVSKSQRIKEIKNKENKTKRGEPGGPVLGKPLCTVLVWAWLIACFFCTAPTAARVCFIGQENRCIPATGHSQLNGMMRWTECTF